MFYLAEISLYYSSERTECRLSRRLGGWKWTEGRRCCGKDLIPGWKLKEHAEKAFATGGVEGLTRYYEACLTGSPYQGSALDRGSDR